MPVLLMPISKLQIYRLIFFMCVMKTPLPWVGRKNSHHFYSKHISRNGTSGEAAPPLAEWRRRAIQRVAPMSFIYSTKCRGQFSNKIRLNFIICVGHIVAGGFLRPFDERQMVCLFCFVGIAACIPPDGAFE
jgi:hypothetical protein